MKAVALEAFPRAAKKRNAVKQLRAGGRVPGVVYGGEGAEARSVEVDTKKLETLLKQATETVLVDLGVDGKQSLTLLQEVQHHPLTREYLHVDFHEVAENQPVSANVPVESKGEPEGVKTDGGLLEHLLYRVRVRALPRDLPELIEVDVSEMEIGDSVTIGHLPLPDGVETLGDPSNTVLFVAKPRKVEEEVVVAEGEEGEEGAEGEEGEAKEGDAKAEEGKAEEKKDN